MRGLTMGNSRAQATDDEVRAFITNMLEMDSDVDRRALAIYRSCFSRRDEPVRLALAYEHGMLRKEELVEGRYYEGYCRNATVAKWDRNNFVIQRTKWNQTFPERLPHPEDVGNFDTFVPVKESSTQSTADK